MNTTYLKYFIETVETGSITKAAKNLFLNYSSLSYGLTELETEIGSSLLIRNKSGVFLTSLGEKVYEESKQILALIESWSTPEPQKNCSLNIYTTLAIYHTFLNDLIYHIMEISPNIDIKIYITQEFYSYFSSINKLPVSQNSIFISSYYTDTRYQTKYIASTFKLKEIPLFQSKTVCYISKNNPLSNNQTLLLENIQNIPLYTVGVIDKSPFQFYQLFDPQNIHTVAAITNIFDLIVKKNGFTFQPEFLRHFTELTLPEKISCIEISDWVDYTYFSLFYQQEIIVNPEIQRIIDAISGYNYSFYEAT